MEYVRDRKSCYIKMQGFKPIKKASAETVRSSDFSPLHCKQFSNQDEVNPCKIHAAFIPLGLLYDDFNGSPFSPARRI